MADQPISEVPALHAAPGGRALRRCGAASSIGP